MASFAAATLLAAMMIVAIMIVAMPTSVQSAAQELALNAYTPLSLGNVKPEGWLRDQLLAESAGLVGQRSLGDKGKMEKSAWLGGPGTNDLAEPFPYWVNGAWALSVLTEDEKLRNLIEGYIARVLDTADAQDGWLGPLKDGNPWSTFRFVTAMATYIDNKPDARMCKALYRFADRLRMHLLARPLKEWLWAYSRWQELFEGYHFLLEFENTKCAGAEITKEDRETLRLLLKETSESGLQWPKWFESNSTHPFTTARARGWFPDNTKDAIEIGYNKWLPHVDRQWTHGVNVGHGMMVWALMYRQTGDASWLERGHAAWDRIMKLHGQATGVFTGDECLSGRTPDRGTETCTVVEIMNSAATMFMASGKSTYMDRVEEIAYNAMPAAFFNGTMWTLNYFQQVNKLDAMDGEPTCERGCGYCFGMVYECCITNHAQGWVRFAARQLMTTPKGSLAVVHYFSSSTQRVVELSGGARIESLRVDTNYPFAESIRIEVRGASERFPLELRIPKWCTDASVRVADGSPQKAPAGNMFAVWLEAGDTDVLLTLPMNVRIERRAPYQVDPPPAPPVDSRAVNVWRGPLLYAMPRSFVRDSRNNQQEESGLLPEGQLHSWNHYLLGTGEWRYALVIGNADRAESDFEVVDMLRTAPKPPKGQGPFAEALVPVALRAKFAPVRPEAWDLKHKRTAQTGNEGLAQTCLRGTTSIANYTTGWADIPPQSPVSPMHLAGGVLTITLIPYGATNLRVAEFPTTSRHLAAMAQDEPMQE